MTQEPANDQYTHAEFDISYSLLHDVVLMEVCLFVMKYEAKKRREAHEKKDVIESEIDRLQNSDNENDRACLDNLKEEL